MIPAQICITDQGTQPLGPFVDIYTYPTPGYSTPFSGNVSTTNMTGVSCTFVAQLPDDVSSVRVLDPSTGCYVDLSVPCGTIDLCLECDFGFANYINTTSRATFGDLSGSCEITDYRIRWYGPDDPNTLAFTTGKGSTFQPYTFTQPLTITNAPLILAGEYKPVIDKVRIDGVNYTETAQTPYTLAILDCLEPITIDPLTCDNGSNFGIGLWPFSAYTHKVTYSATESSPPKQIATFNLSSNTTHFAFYFNGEGVYDDLKISYSGSNYSVPIVLENIRLGSNAGGNDFNPSSQLKTYTSNFRKTLTLTALTRSSNDFLTLEVTPNSANTTTNWQFYFTCLTGLTCDVCLESNTSPQIFYKIITTGFTYSENCCEKNLFYQISGCSWYDIINNDFPTYNETNFATVFGIPFNTIQVRAAYYDRRFQCPLFATGTGSNNCNNLPENNNTIIFEKYINPSTQIGEIKIQCSDQSDFDAYYNSLMFHKTNYSGSTDPRDLSYYRYINLVIYDTTGKENLVCGDGFSTLNYVIRHNTVVTTASTITGKTITLTMPTGTTFGLYTGGTEDWVNASDTTPGYFCNTTISASSATNMTGLWTVDGCYSASTLVSNRLQISGNTTLTSPNIVEGLENLSFCVDLLTPGAVGSKFNVYNGDVILPDNKNLIGTIEYSALTAGTACVLMDGNECLNSNIKIQFTGNSSAIYQIGDIDWARTCPYCTPNQQSVTNSINSSSLSNNYTGTTYKGARTQPPFGLTFFLGTGQTIVTASTNVQHITTPQYAYTTYPMSGSPLTLIPSLSASSCPMDNWSQIVTDGSGYLYNAIASFNIRFEQDEFEPSTIKIYSLPIENYLYSGASLSSPFSYTFDPRDPRYQLIGLWSANTLTIYDSNYFV